MKFLVAVLLSVFVAVKAFSDEFETVLVPLAVGTVDGANGSVWVTDLAIANPTENPIYVTRDGPPTCLPPCVIPPLPPHSTTYVVEPRNASVRGRLLTVEDGRAQDLSFTLRVRDLSRQSQTWGTVVPVVLSRDLYATPFGLTDIPISADFRSMLRIYDVDARTPPRVLVRVLAITEDNYPRGTDRDRVITEFEPAFVLPEPGYEFEWPASVEIPLWILSGVDLGTRVRVEVVPLDHRKDYWGFVSVTHNATQHVSVVTPH